MRLIGLLLLACGIAGAQTNGSAVPFVKPMYFTNGGLPASGYKLCFYLSGTTSPSITFTDSGLGTANKNPVILDISGRADIFLAAHSYKVSFLLPNSSTTDCVTGSMSAVWTEDNIANNADLLRVALAAPTGAGLVGFETTDGAVPLTVESALNITILDSGFTSVESACAAAGLSKTLIITKAWAAITTQTLACNLQFYATGRLQPAPAQILTISGTVTAPESQQIFDVSLGGSGSILFSGTQITVEAPWYGAVADGTTNVSIPVTAAIVSAGSASMVVDFPVGKYAICPSVPWASGHAEDVTLYGDGAKASMFVLHSSCQTLTSSPMLKILTSGNVNIHDIGFDGILTSNTSDPFMGSFDLEVSGATEGTTQPASVRIQNDYFAHGTVGGFQCQPCQNVTHTGNVYFENWWVGAGFSSGGTTASPVYSENFVSCGNQYQHTPIGEEYNFFLRNINLCGEQFAYSSLYVTQMPDAEMTITGASFNHPSDYGGLAAQVGTTGIGAAIYNEGSSNITMENVTVTNFTPNAVTTGLDGAIFALGSTLAIPLSGTPIELPISNVHVSGGSVTNSSTLPFTIAAKSDGASPVNGVFDSIEGTTSTSTLVCPIMDNVNGFVVNNNVCENATTNGYQLAEDTHGTFSFNLGHNIGVLSANNWYGVDFGIVDQDIEAFSNQMVDDSGNVMSGCYLDDSLFFGFPSQIQHDKNICTGWSGIQWEPQPKGPGPVIGFPQLTGTGLNDLTSGGTFSGTTDQFDIIVTSTGTPDIFEWRLNGGSYTTGVSMTGSAQSLADGVTITFAATTGHTIAANCPLVTGMPAPTGGCWTVNATSGGTWPTGAVVENFPTGPNQPLGWKNLATGAPDFVPTGYNSAEVLFGDLPTNPYVGQQVPISNSTTNTWGAIIAGTGSGGVYAVGTWNGTNWTVTSK